MPFLGTGFGLFFVVRVEEMFPKMKLPVPPIRVDTHSMVFLTEGEANMTIGSQKYKIQKDECLFVPSGQVFSFDQPDVNKGYFCNFHNDITVGKFGQKDLLHSFEF